MQICQGTLGLLFKDLQDIATYSVHTYMHSVLCAGFQMILLHVLNAKQDIKAEHSYYLVLWSSSFSFLFFPHAYHYLWKKRNSFSSKIQPYVYKQPKGIYMYIVPLSSVHVISQLPVANRYCLGGYVPFHS